MHHTHALRLYSSLNGGTSPPFMCTPANPLVGACANLVWDGW